MSEGLPKGVILRGSVYHYNRRRRGVYERFSLETGDKAEAVRLGTLMNLRWESEAVLPSSWFRPESQAASDAKGSSFDDLAAAFMKFKRGERLAHKTLVKYNGQFVTFSHWLHDTGNQALADVTEDVAIEYREHRATSMASKNGHPNGQKQAGVSPKTLVGDINALRSCFRWGIKRGFCQHNPFEDVRVNRRALKIRDVESFRPLKPNEIEAFLSAAKNYQKGSEYPDFWHGLMLLSLKTGLRENEIICLEWTDIDWRTGYINVLSKTFPEVKKIKLSHATLNQLMREHQASNLPFKDKSDAKRYHRKLSLSVEHAMMVKPSDIDWESGVLTFKHMKRFDPKATQGKVPMSKGVRALLSDIKERRGNKSNLVFPSHHGGCLSNKVEERVAAIGKMAGLSITQHHDLRHTFATELRRKGTKLETIMVLMRHTNIQMTLRYAQFEDVEAMDGIKVIDADY